jgi:hypothetical protein
VNLPRSIKQQLQTKNVRVYAVFRHPVILGSHVLLLKNRPIVESTFFTSGHIRYHSRSVLATYRMETASTSRDADICAAETTTATPNVLIPVHGNIRAEHCTRVDANVNIKSIQRGHDTTLLRRISRRKYAIHLDVRQYGVNDSGGLNFLAAICETRTTRRPCVDDLLLSRLNR